MNRRLLLPLTLSAALHAAALAAVLVSRSVEEGRAALTIDVVWGEAAGSQGASGATAAVSSGGAAREDVAAAAASAAAVQAVANDGVEREIPAPEISPVASPQAMRAISTEALAPMRETSETIRSSRRRQVVAAKPVESDSGESLKDSGAPASGVKAIAAAGAGRDSDVGRAGAAGDSASGPSGGMAGSTEAVHRVAPAYPMAARRRGLEGSVVLRVTFDAQGRPEAVAVKAGSGSGMLDDAAREAVLRWRFRGGTAGAVDVPITFRLHGAEAVQITDAGRGIEP